MDGKLILKVFMGFNCLRTELNDKVLGSKD
jgi:hypothetical protein